MKILFWLFAFTWIGLPVAAQSGFSFNSALAQQNYDGIFSFQFQNPEQDPSVLEVTLTLEDQFGQVVFTAQSMPIELNFGINNIALIGNRLRNLNFGDLPSAHYFKTTRRLMNGSYLLCIEGLANNLKTKLTKPYQKCFPINIVRPSTLNLLQPIDEDKLCIKPNLLQWLPVFPVVNGATYEVKLVEIKDGQNAESAIVQNIPLFLRNNIPSTRTTINETEVSFVKGKSYAWQVYSTLNSTLIASSEIWSFHLTCPDSTKEEVFNHYILLSSITNNVYSTTKEGKVGVSFFNPYSEQKLSYSLKSVSDPSHKLSQLPVFKIKTGLNKLVFDFKEIKGAMPGQVYDLELYSVAEQTLKLRIQFD
jgi:hypothetical protein